MTLLKRLASLAEVGNVAALMASDMACTMMGTVASMTCGAIVDWIGRMDRGAYVADATIVV